jgi:hypothetical protein
MDGAFGTFKPNDGVATSGVVGAKIDGAVDEEVKVEFDTLVVDSSSLSMKPPSLFSGTAGDAVPNIGALGAV